MRMIDISEAQKHFTKLVNEVIHGREIVITIEGKSVAKLSSINTRPKRTMGLLKGKIEIADDFDAPLPDDILNEFEK